VERTDVVVIGAGAMGSSTAWWLARRGRSVALLEQHAPGHDRGSSHGGTRIFRFGYPDPAYVRMAQEALPLWRELEDDAGVPLLEETGAVDHGDPASIKQTADAMAACGAAHEHLTPEAAHERWPGMRFDGDVLFHHDGGRCLADATVAALHARAAHHGADVRFGLGAITLDQRAHGIEARSPGGDIWRAPVAVVTAGAWLPKVVGSSVPLPPLRVTREQVQHFAPLDAGARWPSFIHHREPWVYGLLTPGEGVKVAAHHVGPEVDPDTSAGPDEAMAAYVVDYVREWFPGLEPEARHIARCLYTTTPDESFVLERHGPLVIGSPCSGHGFKFTPLIGRRLADLGDAR
jgi:sarcosine oxidase